LIEEIQNQRPNRKSRETLRSEIDQIRGEIEENWKFDGQLGVQMHKLETKDQNENDTKPWGWWLSLLEVKLHEIKSLRFNYECN
jgi:hypothetical protein